MLAEFIQLPKAGTTVGIYALQSLISSSIIGNFYQAIHRPTGEDCLLMVLPEGLLRTDSRFQKRLQELTTSQKEYPEDCCVMGARDMVLESGNLYIRYAKGKFRSMTRLVMDSGGPLAEDLVTGVLGRLAHGLDIAAKFGHTHHFLTPDFIFLNEEDQVFVGGIGIFQSIAYESFERYVSAAVMPVQTSKDKTFSAIEILSPEIRNYKSRDARSDFYCIGMCAYFMLLGKKPARSWVLPSQARPTLSPGWDLLLSNCLQASPSARFPNYHTFSRALEAVADNRDSPDRKHGSSMRALNRIPVPKALERRLGFRALLVARILMLMVTGALAVGTAFLLKEILLTDISEDEVVRKLSRVASPSEANLILWLNPARARVEVISGGEGRFFVQGDALFLRGSRGQYGLRIFAENFKPVEFRIELASNVATERRVVLRPAFGQVAMTGFPGSEIFIIKDSGLPLYLGRTDHQGHFASNSRLLLGEHRLRVLHPTSHPAEMAFTLGADPLEISLEQSILMANFSIDSVPQGALVEIAGQPFGKTPLSGVDVSPWENLSLKLSKDGFHPYTSALYLEPGQSFTWPEPVKLIPRIGSLAFEIVWPSAVPDLDPISFSINDDLMPPPDEDGWSLPIGSVSFSVEHPDYFPVNGDIEVREDVLRVVQVQPLPRPARIIPILPDQQSTTLFINGKPATLRPDGSLEIKAFEPVTVEARMRNFLTVVQSFLPSANETITWQVPLQPLPAPIEGEDYTVPYVGLVLKWIDQGGFMLGSPVTEYRRSPNEDSRTFVRFNQGFWVGAFEVTQEQYALIMAANPSNFPGPQNPVEMISWLNAFEFTQRLNQIESAAMRLPEGYVYRLPTEAEWEFFARAGTETPFSFGSGASPSDGNFHGTYAIEASPEMYQKDHYGTMPTGSFAPNPWGIYDVHGNVAEWTLDLYWDRHPGGSAVAPINDQRGRGRTVRGGSWRDPADQARSASRFGLAQDRGRNSIGFRVVLAPAAFSSSFPIPLDRDGGN